jgi:hypothetical protein
MPRGHVTHNARLDETGHHDWLTTLVRGTGGIHGHEMEPPPSPSTSRCEVVLAIIYTTSGTHPLEKKDDVASGLSSSLFFLFLLFLSLSLSHVP